MPPRSSTSASQAFFTASCAAVFNSAFKASMSIAGASAGTSAASSTASLFTSSLIIFSFLISSVIALSSTDSDWSAIELSGSSPFSSSASANSSSALASASITIPKALRYSTPNVLGSAGVGVSDNSYKGQRLILPFSRSTK